MREKQGRGGRRNAQGGTEKRTFFGTDGRADRRTDTGSYRSGAHLKIKIIQKLRQSKRRRQLKKGWQSKK